MYTYPTKISYYPNGNQNKKAIDQRMDFAVEYHHNEALLRKLGTNSYLEGQEALNIQKTLQDATDRFNADIRSVFSSDAFSVVLSAVYLHHKKR